MKAYSEDLRERVVRAVAIGTPREDVAGMFAVSVPTIERWLRLKRETGGGGTSAAAGSDGRQDERADGEVACASGRARGCNAGRAVRLVA